MRELPFSLTPNTDYFLNLPQYQQGLQLIQEHLEKDEGFLKITGETGTGKTLLCKQLIKSLPRTFVTAYVPNPFVSPEGLIQRIASDLEIDADVDQGFYYVQNLIRIRLTQLKKRRKRAILLLDEAQALPEATIQALITMAYLEEPAQKLLQLVLFGQPELEDLLEQPPLSVFTDRITFSYTLPRLSKEQVPLYVNYRINRSGYVGANLFSLPAMKLVAKSTNGNPLCVNRLCHNALMLASKDESNRASEAHVIEAIRLMDGVEMNTWRDALHRHGSLLVSMALVAGVLSLTVLYFFA